MNGYGGEDAPSNPLTSNRFVKSLSARLQFYLDKTTPHVHGRWAGLAAFIVLYGIRVFFIQVHPLHIDDCNQCTDDPLLGCSVVRCMQ